jgi:transglutaminase-like putative cysteine protease
MTILSVRHVTTYRYRKPVSFGEHRMMFRPRDSYDQRLIDSTLFITPEPIGIYWIHDPFGNCVALARFKRQASELRFESRIRVDHYPWNVPDFQTDPQAKSYPFAYSSDEIPDLTPSIARGYPDPEGEIDRWVRKSAHHPMRCLRSSACLQRLWPIFSSRGTGLKSTKAANDEEWPDLRHRQAAERACRSELWLNPNLS